MGKYVEVYCVIGRNYSTQLGILKNSFDWICMQVISGINKNRQILIVLN
jgi:hypothetical protein